MTETMSYADESKASTVELLVHRNGDEPDETHLGDESAGGDESNAPNLVDIDLLFDEIKDPDTGYVTGVELEQLFSSHEGDDDNELSGHMLAALDKDCDGKVKDCVGIICPIIIALSLPCVYRWRESNVFAFRAKKYSFKHSMEYYSIGLLSGLFCYAFTSCNFFSIGYMRRVSHSLLGTV